MIKKVADTNSEYHANNLLGTSILVSGYDSKSGQINLAKVKAYMDNMNDIPKSTQKIFDFGSAQHSVILEQDISDLMVLPVFKPIPSMTKRDQILKWEKENPGAAVPDFSPIKGTTAKSQIEDFKAKNKAEFYLSQKEYYLIEGAFETLSSHSEAARMISNSLYTETSFYDADRGIKCRPDLIGQTDSGEYFVANYKTISSLDKCDSHIYALKYDIRSMMELDIIEKYLKKPVDHYYLIFQEKISPFSMRCIELSDIDKDFAYDEYVKISNMVLMARKENWYPQPPFCIENSKVYRSPQLDPF